jgi:hypothetical protein
MAVKLSGLRAGHPLPPRKIPGPHCATGRIMSIEKFSDLIGNRTRYLATCSIVPQPTALPFAANIVVETYHISSAISDTCRRSFSCFSRPQG